MDASRVLLLSGPFGVGKSSLTRELTSIYDFERISTSAYLNNFIPGADHLGVAELRHAQQLTGDQLDVDTNFQWIVRPVAVEALKAHPSASRWIIDAVRKPLQVHYFRQEFGAAVRHVHLRATEELLRSRYLGSDEQYAEAVSRPNEVSARSLGAIADAVIDVGTLSPAELAAMIVHEVN